MAGMEAVSDRAKEVLGKIGLIDNSLLMAIFFMNLCRIVGSFELAGSLKW